ncbi:MAG: beta-lactamase family protein [Oscillospiraceae bacterium]|nr:beta-lactamase family protein [Oscillospiraceae bacterium]
MQKELDEMLERCLREGEYIGANAAVYRRGECLYLHSVGDADREAGRPMTPDTIFRIYSMTKPVTAAAVMQLTERGYLHPDMLVSRFLPEFAELRVCDADGNVHPARNTLRIQHLLNMQSGLPYAGDQTPAERAAASLFGQMEAARLAGKPYTTRDFCRGAAKLPLAFEPGTHWMYGTSADILGGLVETVTGQSYRDYLMEHIFLPLGMEDTDFFVPPEKQERFAAAYEPAGGTLVRDDRCYLGLNDQRTLPAFQSGGAGLTSTITDYAKFAQALANGGVGMNGKRILSRASVDYIRTPQVTGEGFRRDQDWDSLRGYAYGALVRVLENRAAFGTLADPGEFGWDGWTGTYFCSDPCEHLSILFFIQVSCAGTSLPAKLMRNIVYSHLDTI